MGQEHRTPCRFTSVTPAPTEKPESFRIFDLADGCPLLTALCSGRPEFSSALGNPREVSFQLGLNISNVTSPDAGRFVVSWIPDLKKAARRIKHGTQYPHC